MSAARRKETALIAFADARRARALLDVAAQLLGDDGGRVLGVHATTQFALRGAAGGDFPAAVIEAHAAREKETAAEIERLFRLRFEGTTVSPEWRSVADAMGPVKDRLLPLARNCDFVVTTLPAREGESDPLDAIVEDLAIEAGRPVVAVPDVATLPRVGARPLVAWDGSREAARAVFDATPILRAAEEVRLVSVVEAGDPATQGDAPTAEIAATLSHHGAVCVADRVERLPAGVGATLLAHAEAHGCDLIVMGAYGHSRLRELMFGGASRKLFQQTNVPLFVSH